MSSELPAGPVAVVSPHLDDGVLSLGASISRAVRRGGEARVVTVFGGDPDSDEPASSWDARCGFATAREAVVRRRAEDARACGVLGASAVWLPFSERVESPARNVESIRTAALDVLSSAEAVLLPGFPLFHRDHLFVTRLLLPPLLDDAISGGRRVGLYVEQPYASWGWVRDEEGAQLSTPSVLPALAPLLPDVILSWCPVASRPRDWARKTRAALAYRSQLRPLGRLAIPRVLANEARAGGERVAWIGP